MKRQHSPVRETRHSNKQTPVCTSCAQNLDQVVYYDGHPNSSSEEFVALTNDRLLIFTGDEENLHARDCRPIHKLTSYSVYDAQGHLTRFDTGLVEKNVILRVSGYIKAIYSEDDSIEAGVAAHDLGPINAWYVSGFDGGEQSYVGILTTYAEYILMKPSPEYTPVVISFTNKLPLLKTVVEYLLDYAFEGPTYEDLLYHLQTHNSHFSEEFLLQNAQFICKQVHSFDSSAPDESPLVALPCMKTLLDLSGVTLHKNEINLKTKAKRKHVDRRATTTPLVRAVFERFFPHHIDAKSTKKKRCGICDGCQAPDCGRCANCTNMSKFGGTGTSKQACQRRRCANLDDESDSDVDTSEQAKIRFSYKSVSRRIELPATPIVVHNEKRFYSAACVGGVTVKPDDYVLLNPDAPDRDPVVGKIVSIFTKHNQPTFHAQMFCRGVDTVLGQSADVQELFFVDVCEDCPLASILDTAAVRFKALSPDWSKLGGVQTLNKTTEVGFFFNKKFDTQTARFTHYREEDTETGVCSVCIQRSRRRKHELKSFDGNSLLWNGETFKTGSSVFLDPTVYKFPQKRNNKSNVTCVKVDEEIYPEHYRKRLDVKTAAEEMSEPFCIAQIIDLHQNKKCDEVDIKARLFYRPENTDCMQANEKDVNLVFWTDEVISVSFYHVTGRCHLKYFFCDVSEAADWSEKGPNRFYFTEAYDPNTNEFFDVPKYAFDFGCFDIGKGKGKLKSDDFPKWEEIERPLRCLDVFAGCGGLSLGLHQAGISETKWAIENMDKPAEAFRLNNPNCQVFVDDCNKILKEIISGTSNKQLPQKGDVEILVGGPPCQGFSNMNRFNARQYSLIKNSLIATLLSFCDYYRPHYFVLENVRNFASFRRSMVLKLTTRCLLAMDYQVAFGILQAAHYGLPQTRRRFILIAAAPGWVLPQFPKPQNVFQRTDFQLPITVDGVRYLKDSDSVKSAPYRSICVRDAISDLPPIQNGHHNDKMAYDTDAISHFQRMMRGGAQVLFDHVCKEMAPIVEARIRHIPGIPGADWRDLPNICVKLRDDTLTNKLHYQCYSRKQKKFDQPRAICVCVSGKNCNPQDRQVNTLIPWCLPHTADRNNNWVGLYGRLGWEDVFKTTITNPEPIGKQGKVIHPQQHRVVSVRECARSQGFPDQFRFVGNVLDKHRQIGNAVPPPLGKAIGLEIRRAVASSTKP